MLPQFKQILILFSLYTSIMIICLFIFHSFLFVFVIKPFLLIIIIFKMSKHRHSKDKMHVTYTELRDEWAKKDRRIPFSKLPFDCCALSLSKFQNPVCTPDGNVFDILYILPFIKKYHRNPISGNPLKSSDLIKMLWTKNQKGEYQDPISYKVFTQYSHIVCIRTSGYVYSYDTINELNKKPKFYYDLVTNEAFKNEDIITIQDPGNTGNRELVSFHYLQAKLQFVQASQLMPEMRENETIGRIMQEVELKKKIKKEQEQEEERQQEKEQLKQKQKSEQKQDVKTFIQWCIKNHIYKHVRQTDNGSAGTTSTNFTPNIHPNTNYRQLKQSEIRDKIYNVVRKDKAKGLAQIMTNLGNINVLLHCDLVPKTCQNFIELAQSGYYDHTVFHRLVKDFCLQGGDPTGTGEGGQSIFGRPFNDQFSTKINHNKPGMLSMANSGPNTNKSQFFITLSESPSLNNKHSVFGEVISNKSILFDINKNLTSKSNKPKQTIMIEKLFCYDNPFRKAIKKLKDELKKPTKQQQIQKNMERWIDQKNKKFTLPSQNKLIEVSKPNLSDQLLKDYY